MTPPASVDLSIVIPAYNEAPRIERTLERTLSHLDGRGVARSEILVVDDGSTDGTSDVVEAFAAKHQQRELTLRVVRQVPNQGKGAALRRGVLESVGRRVLLMDADLATPIEELDALAAALDRGVAIATGSRATPTADVRRPQAWPRVLLGRAGNLWIRAWAVPGIHDTQCGFKLFDGAIAHELFADAQEARFGIDIEVLALARRRGYSIAEVGVRWEHQPGSKVRLRDYWQVLVAVPKIAWRVGR